jgi:hypothetical protein
MGLDGGEGPYGDVGDVDGDEASIMSHELQTLIINNHVLYPPMSPQARCGLWGHSPQCLYVTPQMSWIEEYSLDLFCMLCILYITCKFVKIVINWCFRSSVRNDGLINKPKTD